MTHSPEIPELAERLLDRDFSPQEEQALAERIRSDEAFSLQLLQHISEIQTLTVALGQERNPRAIVDCVSRLRAANSSARYRDIRDKIIHRNHSRRKQHVKAVSWFRHLPQLAVAALLALACLAGIVIVGSLDDSDIHPTEITWSEAFPDKAISLGRTYAYGDSIRIRTLATSRLSLSESHDLSIAMHEGAVEVKVNPSHAMELHISLPQADINVVGTHFTIQADQQSSSVAVIDGAIEVGNRDGDRVTVSAGQQWDSKHGVQQQYRWDMVANWQPRSLVEINQPAEDISSQQNLLEHNILEIPANRSVTLNSNEAITSAMRQGQSLTMMMWLRTAGDETDYAPPVLSRWDNEPIFLQWGDPHNNHHLRDGNWHWVAMIIEPTLGQEVFVVDNNLRPLPYSEENRSFYEQLVDSNLTFTLFPGQHNGWLVGPISVYSGQGDLLKWAIDTMPDHLKK